MMIYRFITAIIVCLIAVPVQAVWVDADGAGVESKTVTFTAGISYVPDVAVDSSGNPHIAWYDDTGGTIDVYYLKWNGSAWVDADGVGQESSNISASTDFSGYPKIRLDSFDRPHIVWQETITGGNNEIYYLYWNGTAWVDADGTGRESANVSLTSEQSTMPFFELDTLNKPRITWQEGNDATAPLAEIYYVYLKGTTWVDADGAGRESQQVSSTPYSSMWPHLELDSSNRANIAWADGLDNNREIYFLRWDGSAWVDMDGTGQGSINISNTPDYSSWPNLALDVSGNPYVAFEDMSEGNQEIFLLKWNGSQWVDYDGSGRDNINMSKTYHYSSVPNVKIAPDGSLHVAWCEGSIETCEIYALKLNGSTWVDESGSGRSQMNLSNDFENSEWPSMAIDSSNNVHIIWSNGYMLNEHDIQYLKWSPGGGPTAVPTTTFTYTVNPTQAVTPVITTTPGPCFTDMDGTGLESEIVSPGVAPSMLLDVSGRPNMAWESDNGIYFIRWNGSAWVDADGAGQEGKMISFPVSNCREPSLAFDNSGVPYVAWAGGVYDGWRSVYLLKYNGSYWSDVDGIYNEAISIPVPMGGFPQDVSLSINPLTNFPGVVWSDYPAGRTWTSKVINFAQWEGTEWQGITGLPGFVSITADNLMASSPVLHYDSLGMPNIAYVRGNSAIFQKWNGATWCDATGAGTSQLTAASSAITLDMKLDSAGNPHLAYVTASGFPEYAYWNGSAWVSAYGNTNRSLASTSALGGISMSLDYSQRPHVSWYDTSNGAAVYIWYNGSDWVDVDGASLESMAAIKCPVSINPSIALDSVNKAFIAADLSCAGPDFIGVVKNTCDLIIPTHTVTATITKTCTPTMTPTPYPDGFFAIFPNPFNPDKAFGGVLKIGAVEPGDEFWIYTVTGEMVVKLTTNTQTILWDGKNRYKFDVAPGVYFYMLREKEGAKPKATGKLFVVRDK